MVGPTEGVDFGMRERSLGNNIRQEGREEISIAFTRQGSEGEHEHEEGCGIAFLDHPQVGEGDDCCRQIRSPSPQATGREACVAAYGAVRYPSAWSSLSNSSLIAARGGAPGAAALRRSL